MFQSEIRESQINDLFEKVRSRNYGKYLLRIVIEKARSISNKAIDFEFPVTAIVGPNGGGKTTIAGAAAILYKEIAPAQFFAKSGKYDASMLNWKIEYEAIDKTIKSNDTVRKTAKYHNLKWVRRTLDREVLVFGVSRTVPAAERKELRKCVSNNFEVGEDKVVSFPERVTLSVSSILDKDVSDYKNIQVDEKGNVTLLSGVNDKDETFSEFHFGAGESSIIRMVTMLEGASDNSLVLIEEIENGLHPVATIRMVEYLIELAERKKIQAIFTTHSNDALVPLPSNAIWASVNGDLYKGKLDIRSLRAISGQIGSKLVIFVEDDFAERWVNFILTSIEGIARDAVSIHPMKGDGTAIKVHKNHNIDPSVLQKSACIIDGDSEQKENEAEYIFRLPGQCPESSVYDNILEKIDEISGELSVALLKPYDFESQLKGLMQSVRNTNRDPHLLYAQLGKKLGFIPEARVKEAFLTIWCRLNSQYVDSISNGLSDLIPLESDHVDISQD
ncbi:AAA family ATPase [Desulfonema ishimotonii]|uniref:AAA family ATPase n=1 Tax=Desulfonema ishimotonii TaxID=45657 RepID=A0A401FVZ9_9BACT|nr:AAA family ATPase [Desulfonema ishimotonii]GBC61129.1 AAA family ATPase [Desulfonema ishimotonii]